MASSALNTLVTLFTRAAFGAGAALRNAFSGNKESKTEQKTSSVFSNFKNTIKQQMKDRPISFIASLLAGAGGIALFLLFFKVCFSSK